MFFISMEVNPTNSILLARDKALAIEIEVLKLENFPGPLLIYCLLYTSDAADD